MFQYQILATHHVLCHPTSPVSPPHSLLSELNISKLYHQVVDVEWQARPDPPASRQMQKHMKNINARDHPDTRRQEESGLTFRREEHSPFSFLLVFTGAPFATIPNSIACPYWAPPQLSPTAPLIHSTFDLLLSSPIFDSTPLSISLVIAFLSNLVPTCIKAVL